MEPLVSIIIPVYNGSNYMKEAIDSAIHQTYSNIEVIVVNDGSNDGGATEKIALSYGESIRYIHKKNGGSSSALNCGIAHMRGDYFSWLSHDDVYLPDKIKTEMEVAKENPGNVIICDSYLIDYVGNRMIGKKNNLFGIKNAESAFFSLIHGHGINGCTVLVPKKVIDTIGYFDEEMIYLNDLDYWYRMMFTGVDIVYIKDQLVKNRIHGQQVSVKKIDLLDKEKHYLIRKCDQNLDRVKINKEFVLEQLAYFCANEGLNNELKMIWKHMKCNMMSTNSLYFKLQATKVKGKIIQTLKTFRRRFFFHR